MRDLIKGYEDACKDIGEKFEKSSATRAKQADEASKSLQIKTDLVKKDDEETGSKKTEGILAQTGVFIIDDPEELA